jgi:hypothetical protein
MPRAETRNPELRAPGFVVDLGQPTFCHPRSRPSGSSCLRRACRKYHKRRGTGSHCLLAAETPRKEDRAMLALCYPPRMLPKSSAQLDREIAEALANASEGFKIGDVVQFRWEPNTGGVIRRLASNGEASVMTPRGERSIPTDALRHVHKAHVSRVRRAVESRSQHAVRAHAKKKTTRHSAPKFEKFDERHGDDWFPLWKFREMVVDGRVFNEDGSGKYGKLDGGQRRVSNVKVDLSSFGNKPEFDRRIPTWARSVVWSTSRRNT